MITLAYVDPGLGALLWQTIVSALVGLFFYVKQTRKWAAGILLRLLRQETKRNVPNGID